MEKDFDLVQIIKNIRILKQLSKQIQDPKLIFDIVSKNKKDVIKLDYTSSSGNDFSSSSEEEDLKKEAKA